MIDLSLYNRVYISGPITGIEDLNREEFQKAENMFLSLRKIVTNPHKIVPYDLIVKHADNPKKLWTEAMKICIKHIPDQDAIFVLDGWNSSRGSTVEIFTGQTLSIPVFYFKNMSEFDISFQLIKYPRGLI